MDRPPPRPDRRTLFAALALLVLVCAAYSNHFRNPFDFDDIHTIVDNAAIRDLKNIPRFFTDGRAFGTRSDLTHYRPIVATLNAIDYRLAGGLKPAYFHVHIFLSYLALLVLLAILFAALLRQAEPGMRSDLLAVLLAGFYGVHTANAETINYIIMRSDSFSTLCIVASFLLYLNASTRRWHLYLLPMVLGILTKDVGTLFAPILFFYILLFEEGMSLGELVRFKRPAAIVTTLRKVAPALLVTIALYAFIRIQFASAISVTAGSLLDRWQYFYSQWVVITHYLGNFILPLNLSAEPDLGVLPTMVSQKVLLSLALLLTLWVVAFVASTRRSGYPITFGILWYFITLAPTSSIIVIDQPANDHRTFLSNIGLVLAAGWSLHLLFRRWSARLRVSMALRWGLAAFGAAVFLLHGYGTYQRNIVWSSSDRLWADAARKSPNNGRALMNYGLTLMARGDYEGAERCYRRTLELMPRWAYIHVNMAIVRNARGFPEEAETYFRDAIRYQPTVPESYYHYAWWLIGRDRRTEAREIVAAGLHQSPSHIRLQELQESLSAEAVPDPGMTMSAEQLVDLSLTLYRAGRYRECVAACERALALNPNYAAAYNNICSAYNSLGEWDRAIAACNRALEIAPDFRLARGNLNWALSEKSRAAGARKP